MNFSYLRRELTLLVEALIDAASAAACPTPFSTREISRLTRQLTATLVARQAASCLDQMNRSAAAATHCKFCHSHRSWDGLTEQLLQFYVCSTCWEAPSWAWYCYRIIPLVRVTLLKARYPSYCIVSLQHDYLDRNFGSHLHTFTCKLFFLFYYLL